jgi:hypothetical protein
MPFAVDLDVDEQVVHDARVTCPSKPLVRHDVTPQAGAVPDRQQDRLVRRARGTECGLRPRPPIDRVIGVLAQVGLASAARRFDIRQG